MVLNVLGGNPYCGNYSLGLKNWAPLLGGLGYLEGFRGVRRSSEEFGGQFGGVRRSSEELGDLIRGSSEVFGGVRRTSEGLGKCPKNALGLQKYTLNFNGPKRIVIHYFTIF